MRGLFLRAYLCQAVRGLLPDTAPDAEAGSSTEDAAGGDTGDALEFLLQNFTEMNKLWVRMQHQASAKRSSRAMPGNCRCSRPCMECCLLSLGNQQVAESVKLQDFASGVDSSARTRGAREGAAAAGGLGGPQSHLRQPAGRTRLCPVRWHCK